MDSEQILQEILNLSDMCGPKPMPIDKERRLMEIKELVQRELERLQQEKMDVRVKKFLLEWITGQPPTRNEPFDEAWKRLRRVIEAYLEEYPGELTS